MPNKQNILLINVHSIRNAGDAALTHEAISQLDKAFPDSQFSLVMNDPDTRGSDGRAIGSLFSWVKPDGRWNLPRLVWLLPACLIPVLSYRLFGQPLYWFTQSALRTLISAYIQADVVVSIPGGFYYSSGRGLTLLLTSLTIGLANLARKPLYILPQSFGPLRFRWECCLARWTLKPARLIMARERISLDQLDKCRLPASKCHIIPDLAFGYIGADSSRARDWLRANGINRDKDKPLLGVTVVNWEAQDKTFQQQELYENAIANAIQNFTKNIHGKVIILPQCSGPSTQEDDRLPARRIVGLIAGLSKDIHSIEEPLPPDLLKAVLGEMDVVIGTRMHSNIFALSQNVPVIAIGYLPKTRGIAQMVGIEEWVIDIDQLDDINLNKVFSMLWNDRDKVSDHLRQVIPQLIQQSQEAGMLVAKDYATLK